MKKTSAYINDPAKYCHVPKLICLLDYHGQHSQSDALKPYPSEIHLSTWQRIRLFYRLNSFKSIVWGFLLLLFLFCFPSSRLPVFSFLFTTPEGLKILINVMETTVRSPWWYWLCICCRETVLYTWVCRSRLHTLALPDTDSRGLQKTASLCSSRGKMGLPSVDV